MSTHLAKPPQLTPELLGHGAAPTRRNGQRTTVSWQLPTPSSPQGDGSEAVGDTRAPWGNVGAGSSPGKAPGVGLLLLCSPSKG